MLAQRPCTALALTMLLAAPAQAMSLGDVGDKVVDTAKDVGNAGEKVADKIADKGTDLYDDVASWKDQAPEALRRRKCDEEQGRWVAQVRLSACENGETRVDLDGEMHIQPCGDDHRGGEAELQCVHFDDAGRVYFNDGPSVPPAMVTISGWLDDRIDQLNYEEIFWQAGVDHDHCYHSNPVTYGLSKRDCDDRFISDLEALCESHAGVGADWFHDDVCRTYAALMYGAVRAGGEESWAAFDAAAAYPQGAPMWQQLGLDKDPFTPETQASIDDILHKFNITDDSAS